MKSSLTFGFIVFVAVFCLFLSTGFAEDSSEDPFRASHELLGQVAVAPLKECKQSAMLWTLKSQCPPVALGVGKARSFLKENGIDACNLDRNRGAGALLFYSQEGFPSLVSLIYLPTRDSQAVAQYMEQALQGSVSSEKSSIVRETIDCCGVSMIRVSGDRVKPWYIRTAGDWTFLSRLDAALLDLPQSPDLYGKLLTKEYLVGWQIHFDLILNKQADIQEELRTQGRQALASGWLGEFNPAVQAKTFLSEVTSQLPPVLQTELKKATAAALTQVFCCWSSSLASLPDSLEGGWGIDKKSGSLFAQARAAFNPDRPDTLYQQYKKIAVARPRFDYVLNSSAAVSMTGVLPQSNVEWLAQTMAREIPFRAANSGAESESPEGRWREWGLAADFNASGVSLGLATTSQHTQRVGKALYELAAHRNVLPETDARRWGLPGDGTLSRTGRHVKYQINADVMKSDGNQSSASFAFGPGECLLGAGWNDSGLDVLGQILAVRYQPRPAVIDSRLDSWLFCGQARLGNLLSAENSDKRADKDRILVIAGLKGDSILVRVEMEKDIVPAVVRLFEGLAVKDGNKGQK